MVVFVKTFDYYHHNFYFANFFSFPIKLLKSLKLKFRPKFNHGFTIIRAIYNVLFETLLTLLRMGFFRAAHGLNRGQKDPLPEISLIYPTMMTLGTVFLT